MDSSFDEDCASRASVCKRDAHKKEADRIVSTGDDQIRKNHLEQSSTIDCFASSVARACADCS